MFAWRTWAENDGRSPNDRSYPEHRYFDTRTDVTRRLGVR